MVASRLTYPLRFSVVTAISLSLHHPQSQCNCRSDESRKSEENTVGEEIPAVPGMVRSNHSMLSRPVSCRCRAEVGVSVKVRSEVSIGEFG